MITKRLVIIFLFALAVITTCGKVSDKQNPEDSKKITDLYSSNRIDTTFRSENGIGYEIQLEYPRFKEQFNAINLFVDSILISEIDIHDTKPSTVDEFLEDILDLVEELDSEVIQQNWFFTFSFDVKPVNNRYLSFEISRTSFTGGAHPNSEVKLMTISMSDDVRVLSWKDVIKNEQMKNFTSVVDSLFKESKDLSYDADYEDAGFWFTNNEFVLKNEFSIDNTAIQIHYNPYEIAPYSFGSTRVNIPISRVKQYLMENPFGFQN